MSTDELVVRDVRGPLEMMACDALYRRVMRLGPGDGSINPRLLIALQHNGGYVVGAYAGPELVGFVYSFLGSDRSTAVPAVLYQYSQLAVVAQDRQGQGIGRQLKHAQRERCLQDGIYRMRWAFDPLKTRNAHFNLDVLGGEITALVPAMYGARGFGADDQDESDRFIVDWHLARPVVPQRSLPPTSAHWLLGRCVADRDDLLIAAPAQWDRHRTETGSAAATRLRGELRAAFAAALDSGRIGVSCQRISADIAVYRFAPRRASITADGD
jgi:predicted GNAT superfamily acetyltransferase